MTKTVACEPMGTELMTGLHFLWLEITQKCNLSCVHCYADSNPHQPLFGAMQDADWLRVIDEAFDAGCRQLQFIGGEPTLHPSLDFFIQHAAKKGYTFIEVFTNGTRLPDKRLDLFSKLNVNLACSFYSQYSQTHDEITQKKGSHKSTLDSIEKILQRGIPLRVGIIEMDHNAGQVSETLDFLRTKGVQRFSLDRIREVGRGHAFSTPQNGLDDVCGHCWKGRLCVTTDGSAFPCIMSRSVLTGSVLDSSVKQVLESHTLGSFRAKVHKHFQDLDEANHSSGCSPDMWCSPHNCAPNGCSPKDCAPSNCSPGPLHSGNLSMTSASEGCSPDWWCAPQNCAPNGCSPKDCGPNDCSPGPR